MLSLPFIVYIIVVFFVDPFNYFNFSHLVPDSIKIRTSKIINPVFWKLTDYRKHPMTSILLGDSRSFKDIILIDNISGDAYFDFGYPGGTLSEIISTFKEVSKRTRLKNIYISVNFDLYNQYSREDRAKSAINTLNNPMLYFFDTDVLRSFYYIFKICYLDKSLKIWVPRMTKQSFWAAQVRFSAYKYFSKYKYPENIHDSLIQIGNYCKTNSIKLVFIIPPTHIDLQNRVSDFNLQSELSRFKSDLSSIAATYDFDYRNSLTINMDNFKDPYHYTKYVEEQIIREVWGGKIKYARLLGTTTTK